MKTFLQWAEDNGYDVRIVTDTEKPTGKKKRENRVRTGITHNYPDAYVRGQYPEGQFPPYKGTAFLDLKQKAASSYKGPKAAS